MPSFFGKVKFLSAKDQRALCESCQYCCAICNKHKTEAIHGNTEHFPCAADEDVQFSRMADTYQARVRDESMTFSDVKNASNRAGGNQGKINENLQKLLLAENPSAKPLAPGKEISEDFHGTSGNSRVKGPSISYVCYGQGPGKSWSARGDAEGLHEKKEEGLQQPPEMYAGGVGDVKAPNATANKLPQPELWQDVSHESHLSNQHLIQGRKLPPPDEGYGFCCGLTYRKPKQDNQNMNGVSGA